MFSQVDLVEVSIFINRRRRESTSSVQLIKIKKVYQGCLCNVYKLWAYPVSRSVGSKYFKKSAKTVVPKYLANQDKVTAFIYWSPGLQTFIEMFLGIFTPKMKLL